MSSTVLRPIHREVAAHDRAVVVVAGQHVHRHGQPGEELGHPLVLGRGAALAQVTADEHGVGRGVEGHHRLDHRGETARALVAVALVAIPRSAHVQVAQLGEHEGRHAGIVSRPRP